MASVFAAVINWKTFSFNYSTFCLCCNKSSNVCLYLNLFKSFFQVWTRQTYQRDCPVCGALWQSQTIWTVMAMISLSPRNSSTQWSPPEITRTYTESSSWTRKGDAHTAYIRSVLLHLYFFLCVFPLRIFLFVTPPPSGNRVYSSHIISIITAGKLSDHVVWTCANYKLFYFRCKGWNKSIYI